MRRNKPRLMVAVSAVILVCVAFPALAAGTASPSNPPRPATAQDDPAKVQAAKIFIPLYHPMLDKQRFAKHLDELLPRMAESAKIRDPNVDTKKFMEKTRAMYLEKNAEALDRQSHIVSRHFSLQELNQLIEFFKGPAGKKLVDETPKIMQEMKVLYGPPPLKPGDIVDMPERKR